MLWGSKKSGDTKSEKQKTGVGESTSQKDAQLQDIHKTGTSGTRPTTSSTGRKPTQASKPVIPRDELPRFLVTEGHISEDDVRYALKLQQETGVFFGEILAKEGVLGSQSLVSFLAKHCKIPHIGLLDYLIDKSLLSLIPQELCWRYHLLPVDKMGRNLTVAMVNPLNHAALQAVRALCPDLRIKPILCSHEHFETVAQKLFGEHDGHDESEWADIPVADEEKPSTPPHEVKPEKVEQEDSDPVPETAVTETTPSVSAHEETTAASTPAPDASQEETNGISQENNKLLDSVFGTVTVEDATAAEEADTEAQHSFVDEKTTLESIMHTYTDAMVNSMHDTYELLARKISFFKGVSPEDVAKIFAQGNVVEYAPATMLFDKGDTGDKMFVILNGRVKIRDGAKQIAILHTGDIFGEMSLVSDAPRSATAVTMTQTDLLTLSFDDILNNIQPQVAAQLLVNIIVTLANRLRQANTE